MKRSGFLFPSNYLAQIRRSSGVKQCVLYRDRLEVGETSIRTVRTYKKEVWRLAGQIITW
jgi:hypothetical protein